MRAFLALLAEMRGLSVERKFRHIETVQLMSELSRTVEVWNTVELSRTVEHMSVIRTMTDL